MNIAIVIVALTIGCAGGGVAGWGLRRVVVRWCRRCGQPVGTMCIECRDRHRAANLRQIRNQRHDMISGAA
jgi:hypothetical protein